MIKRPIRYLWLRAMDGHLTVSRPGKVLRKDGQTRLQNG